MLGAGGIPASFRILDPSIVGDVDYYGVVAQFALFQNIDQLPAGLVKPGTHGIVLGDGQGKTHFPIGLEQALGWVVGGMRKEDSVPEKEGLLLGHRMIHEFLDRLQPGSADFQPVVSMTPAFLRKPAGHSMGESTVLVVSFPPLSTLVTEVSLFAEQLGQGFEAVEVGNELGPLVVVKLALDVAFGRGIITRDAVLVGVLPVDQGDERRPAQGGGNIPAFEKNALLGKLVQMRGLDLGMPHESVIGPCLIIGDDIENVGGFFCGCKSATEEEAKEAEGVFFIHSR